MIKRSSGGFEPPDTVKPRSLERARADLGRYFFSSASRNALGPMFAIRLDEIRESGNSLLNALKPYRWASVFSLSASQKSYQKGLEDGADENESAMAAFRNSAMLCRDSLDSAITELMPELFAIPIKAKGNESVDVQATAVVSALFFIGALAKYCPDIILEGDMDPDEKNLMAERFIIFYDGKIEKFTGTAKRLATTPKCFYEDIYLAYTAFKNENPVLFDKLREKVWVSGGQLMAPYQSDKFDQSWIPMHYLGKL